MRRYSIVFVIFSVLIASCTKTPSACLNGPTDAFIVKPVGFTNCSSDYDFCFWEFGDGLGSEEENTSHTYSTPGTYEVKLTAYSDDGRKEDAVSTSLNVGYMVIDKFEIRSWNQVSGFPDIQVEINGISSNETLIGAGSSLFPYEFTFPQEVKLTRESNNTVIIGKSASKPNGEFYSNDIDFHISQDNPVRVSSSPEIYVYWHYSFE